MRRNRYEYGRDLHVSGQTVAIAPRPRAPPGRRRSRRSTAIPSWSTLAYGLNPVMAALLGMLTGIGCGMTREVLLSEIPTVLRADLYAVAALAGAAVVVIGGAGLRLPSTAVTTAGAVLCFGLRFLAIRRGWHLPIADEPKPPTTKARAPKDRKDDGAARC